LTYFFSQDQDLDFQTLFFVLEVTQDQDLGLENYITGIYASTQHAEYMHAQKTEKLNVKQIVFNN